MGFGEFGWIGKFKRLLGIPDGSVDDEPAQSGRARLRYNHPKDRLEVSKSGASYVQIEDGPDAYETVATVSDVSSLDDAELEDGTVVYVRSLKDEFVLSASSTLTVDGITVAATQSGSGRWVRRQIGSFEWRAETTWYVDFAAGDDENVGTSQAAPLRTYDEFERRLGAEPVTVFYTVNLLSDYADQLRVTVPGAQSELGALGGIALRGSTSNVDQFEVDSATAHDNATQVFGTVTATGGFDLSPHVGRRLIVLDGASAGAYAWIGGLGATTDVGRVGEWVDPSTFQAIAPPAPGDNVAIVSTTELSQGITINNDAQVSLREVRTSGAFRVSNANASLVECRISDQGRVFGSPFPVFLHGCLLDDGTDILVKRSGLTIGTPSMFAGELRVEERGELEVKNTLALIGDSASASGFQLDIANAHLFQNGGDYIAGDGHDATAGRGVLQASDGARLDVATAAGIWATSVTTAVGSPAIDVRRGCVMTYPAGGPPSLAPDTDIRVGGVDTTIGALPQQPAGTLAAIFEEA